MEPVDIEGVKILFPYKPYDIQLDYMKCVIKCLQQKTNGLLESPTGTGKTVCILCSTLGWLDTQRTLGYKQLVPKNGLNSEDMSSVGKSSNGWQLGAKDLPQILYSSRTHSQLSQACKELKRTAYKTYKSVVIGSRDQLCLNPEVTSLETISAKNQMCRFKIASNSCCYYRNYENKVDRNEDYNTTQVFDIEDLVKLGKKNSCCPYYASRYIRSKASLVFTPYNYILDPQIRQSNSLDLKNSVVIFDEGHNIERICEESVSTELKSETFAVCIKSIDSVLKTLMEMRDGSYSGLNGKDYSELDLENVAKLKIMVCDLEMTIDSMVKKSSTLKTLHETQTIFDIIDRIGLEINTVYQWSDIMDKISMALTNSSELNSTQATVLTSSFTSLIQFVEKLVPISVTTSDKYKSYKKEFIQKFKIFSERGNENQNENQNKSFWSKKSDPNSWILHIWCMSPSIGAKALLDLGIHSMIITSGTLAPISSFEIEMDLNFPIKLQNDHIIKEHQLSIINISNARDGTVLTSKYDNRDNLNYYRGLGETLIDLMKVVPKGALVFFSSYTALNKCIQIWKQKDQNIWAKLNGVKQIFLEPRSKITFNDCIVKYKLKIDEYNSNGAVFFGVCRGKLSEGIDLPDDYCRCVIMTGLPFPSVADPRVMLKKKYLNEAKTDLTANNWYALQMKRALNQSIGRVVRHKNDYGIILLLDSRFASMSDGLSKWVEKFIHKNRIKHLDQGIDKIKSFFATNGSIKNSDDFTYVNENIFETNVSTDKISTQISVASKSWNSTSQKSAVSKFIDEKSIFNEFKSNSSDNSISTVSNSNSIFDTISSSNSCKTLENNLKECSQKQISTNKCNESPLKKLKSSAPPKVITPSTDPKLKAETIKLHSIIKTKLSSETNSSKKVQWNDNNNRIYEIKPIVLDFSEDEEEIIIDKNLKVVTAVEDKPKPVVITPIKSNEEMLDFWRKCGAELKELFKGSNKFNQLCQTIKTYKKYKNLRLLSMSFIGIFDSFDEQKRNHFIKELSIIVPKSDYNPFLRLCNVKDTDEGLTDNN